MKSTLDVAIGYGLIALMWTPVLNRAVNFLRWTSIGFVSPMEMFAGIVVPFAEDVSEGNQVSVISILVLSVCVIPILSRTPTFTTWVKPIVVNVGIVVSALSQLFLLLPKDGTVTRIGNTVSADALLMLLLQCQLIIQNQLSVSTLLIGPMAAFSESLRSYRHTPVTVQRVALLFVYEIGLLPMLYHRGDPNQTLEGSIVDLLDNANGYELFSLIQVMGTSLALAFILSLPGASVSEIVSSMVIMAFANHNVAGALAFMMVT